MSLPFDQVLLNGPHYETQQGFAFLGDSLQMLNRVADESLDLIITSPPYGLTSEKEYGNVAAHEYIEWFIDFARQFHRILKPSGSLVIELGGTWNTGSPTRSLYNFELLITLCREHNFYLAQDFYWNNSAKLPTPAHWVTVHRKRVKDSITPIWWLSKTLDPKADNRKVLKPYSKAMEKLLERGRYNSGPRPSGHDIPERSFVKNNNGAIPSNFFDQLYEKSDLLEEIPYNVLEAGNTDSNSSYLRRCREFNVIAHPARFVRAIPEFFIKYLTDPNDWVLDPFGGSNMVGRVAESHQRRWLSMEINRPYWANSILRFDQGRIYNDSVDFEATNAHQS